MRLQGTDTPIPASRRAQLAPEGAGTGQAEEVAQREPPARRGGGAFRPPPVPVIPAGVTVAPAAGTPQGPREQEIGGLSLTPAAAAECALAPRCPLGRVLTVSPKNETSLQRPESLPRPAPVIPKSLPSGRPSASPHLSPPHCSVHHKIPKVPEAPNRGGAPRSPGLPDGPTLHPLHLFLQQRPRGRGCACAGGGRRGSLRPEGLSEPRGRDSAEPGCLSRIRLGLVPSAATSEPPAPPPGLRRRSSGNR